MPGYHLPLFAADATGIWESHGLEVELVDPAPGPENAKAVADGHYDACLTSVAHFLNAKADEPTLAAMFVFMIARRLHLAAFAIEARPAEHGRPIAEIRDLEGASFLGEAESPFVREYIALLHSLALEPGRGVPVAYDDQFSALAAGEGDVGIDFLNLRPRFAAELRARQRLCTLPFFRAGIDLYGSGLVVGTRWLKSGRETARRLAAALRDSLMVTRADPVAGLDGLIRRFPETDPKIALSGWTAGVPLVFAGELGGMDGETWRRTIEHHALVHGTPRFDVDSVFEDVLVSGRTRAATGAAANH